jgi:hypothetical protein
MTNEIIPLPVPQELEDKFWERVKVGEPDECWIWQGNKSRKGYGVFHMWRTRQNARAHRLSFAIATGSLPEGYYICHRCDNPPCVNPAHLFAGTPTENAHDRDRKGRHVMAPHVVAKLTEEQVSAILLDDRPQTVIGREYGVDRTIIGRAKRGQSYRRITNPEAIYGKG